MKKSIKNLVKYVIIMILIMSSNCFALTVNNYNRFCEDGKLLNIEIKFNDVVAKYNKYGHYKLGDDYMPTGDLSDPLSNEGDRDMAHLAVAPDTTYKIYGEIDEEEMDYSYYDYEGLTASDIKVYELQAKLEALKIGNQVQERSGYGKYNLRNGKNLIAFIKFAYEFYRNSGEYRVGIKDDKLFKDTLAQGYKVCPMELLEEYASLNSTSAVELNNGFEDKFKDCVSKWEYIGNKELENQEKIFETLEDIYMGLVYLYPALKVLQNEAGMNLDDLDDDDRAAIFSMAYEVKGMQPITSANVSDEQLTRKFSRIGTGDLIGALIEDEELNFSVAETVYRYMIEIKHKNNPQNLARWVAEYEDIFGTYEPLDPDSYDRFMKAYNIAFAKYGSDVSRQTGLDYVFFGYVEHPELFESKNSLREMTERFANHLRAYFSDSAFIRNKDNANYVAKSYMMAQKMCENTGFLDITDIYASDICLVEHSYGYNSTEYILSDTQVVSLEGTLEEGDFDTDKDEVSDRDEIGIEEEVNISRLLEAYIKYNKLPEEEANKLRATPTVKMYNYISNPVLPDSDFDGRDDLRDRGRALDNSYEMTMDTDVVDRANYDLNVDYRYFFMDNTKYYPELSDMAVTLANMVTRKGWQNKNWNNKTENLNGSDIQSFMYHYGNEDIEVHDMSNYYSDANVCRYAMGQHDVFLRRGKVNHKVRNVITVVLGEIPEKTAELTANLYGLLGDNEEYSEYHHIGYDITSSRILENVQRFADRYNGNQKVFFITGARSAGGVANLLAKKLIDKFGPSSVYGYTFNAVSTINGNMIPEGSKIPNLKYQPIMNIYNDDEMMVMFTSEETNMYKYGTNVHMSLSENLTSKVASAFRKVHKKKYDTLSVSKAKEFINNYLLEFMEGIVYGMAGTLNLKNVFSGETNTDLQMLATHWKLLYEATPNNEYYEEANNICKLRLSGVKLDSFEDYVAYKLAQDETGNTGHTPPSIPPNSSGYDITYTKTIKEALDIMAQWYVDNVFTYMGNKKYEDFAQIDRNIGTVGYRKYMLGSGTDYRVEFLKDSTGNDNITSGNYQYIGAEEGSDTVVEKNHIKYYFKRTTDNEDEFNDDWICYIKASKAACENNYSYRKSGSLNYYINCDKLSRDVGDDCTRFAFAVLEKGTGVKAEDLGNIDTDAKQFVDDIDEHGTIEKMSNYFDIYEGEDLKKLFNNEFTGDEAYKNGIQPGDMLVGAITDGNSYNHCEFIWDINYITGHQNRVYGWGSVKNKLESYAKLSMENNKIIDSNNSGYKYSALYRKKVQ